MAKLAVQCTYVSDTYLAFNTHTFSFLCKILPNFAKCGKCEKVWEDVRIYTTKLGQVGQQKHYTRMSVKKTTKICLKKQDFDTDFFFENVSFPANPREQMFSFFITALLFPLKR